MMKNQRSKKRKWKDFSMTTTTTITTTPAVSKTYPKQELGGNGIKISTTNHQHWDKPKTISSFQVTRKENKRRKLRQLRFSACTPEPTDDDIMPMLLDTALTSSRNSVVAATADHDSSMNNHHGYKNQKKSSKSKKSSSSDDGIVGTSTKLEKSYLRLTTFPKPQDIRPPPILQRALQHIKTKYIQDEDFDWANDQLKAVRQDLTVQGIRSGLCVEVYEMHARILLEHGDLNEFNQCQSMIRTLTTNHGGQQQRQKRRRRDGTVDYEYHHHDSETWKKLDGLCRQTKEHRDEFQAYQLLYSLVQNSWTDLTRALGSTDMSGQSCQHAILVIKSVIHNDYHGFFRLYESAPHLSAYLMDFLVKRVRSEAYDRIVASYRPTMGIEYFRESLQFPNLEETRDFLKMVGAEFLQDTEAASWVDCRASHAKQLKNKGKIVTK